MAGIATRGSLVGTCVLDFQRLRVRTRSCPPEPFHFLFPARIVTAAPNRPIYGSNNMPILGLRYLGDMVGIGSLECLKMFTLYSFIMRSALPWDIFPKSSGPTGSVLRKS